MLSDTLLASKVLFKHSLLLFTSKRLLLLSTLTGKVELETNHTLNTPQAVVAGIFRISDHSFVIVTTFADNRHNLITQYACGEICKSRICLESWVDIPRPETIQVNEVFHICEVTENEIILKVWFHSNVNKRIDKLPM